MVLSGTGVFYIPHLLFLVDSKGIENILSYIAEHISWLCLIISPLKLP